ncbi:MAG: hypothetical protein J6J87_01760, partial [Oscillospiraceae bacterium]|nr:hypothetical protein [Oscillospiraceae bacterium]
AEAHVLIAEFTFSHFLSLLTGQDAHRTSATILAEPRRKCKGFFSKSPKKSKISGFLLRHA